MRSHPAKGPQGPAEFCGLLLQVSVEMMAPAAWQHSSRDWGLLLADRTGQKDMSQWMQNDENAVWVADGNSYLKGTPMASHTEEKQVSGSVNEVGGRIDSAILEVDEERIQQAMFGALASSRRF
eukprot:s1564_g3.t1